MCLVTLYQYWEDNYRALLADALGVEKKQIQVPLFGELRRYRQAILHNRGIATSDMEECTILKWYKRGDHVLLNREKFEEIIDAVFEFLDTFEKEPEQFIKRA